MVPVGEILVEAVGGSLHVGSALLGVLVRRSIGGEMEHVVVGNGSLDVLRGSSEQLHVVSNLWVG